MFRIGFLADVDDVMLDDHGIPRIASHDTLPLAHPPPAAEAPAHKTAEQKRLADMLVEQQTLVGVLQQRVDMRASLVKSGTGPVSTLYDAQETLGYHATNYATTKGQLKEAEAAIEHGHALEQETEAPHDPEVMGAPHATPVALQALGG